MNPSYEDFVDQTFSKRYRQLELEIMKDIVRRIKKTSEITSSVAGLMTCSISRSPFGMNSPLINNSYVLMITSHS